VKIKSFVYPVLLLGRGLMRMCGVSGGAFEVTARSSYDDDGGGVVFESSAQFRRFDLDHSEMFSRFCQ
jgi:hypothetical protein